MLDGELVPTEAFQHRKQDWLSTIRTSSAVGLERHLIIFSGKTESKSIEVDRVPEARIGYINIDHEAFALNVHLAISSKQIRRTNKVPQQDGWIDIHPSWPRYLRQARYAPRSQRDARSMNVAD